MVRWLSKDPNYLVYSAWIKDKERVGRVHPDVAAKLQNISNRLANLLPSTVWDKEPVGTAKMILIIEDNQLNARLFHALLNSGATG